MVLCLKKAINYDDPGRHDLKQQTMRINDLPHRLQICSGASGSIEIRPVWGDVSVRAGVSFWRNTHALARGFAVFCMPVTCHCELMRA